jgi:hypothetical protein
VNELSGDHPLSSKPRLGRFIVPSPSFLSVGVARGFGSFGLFAPDLARLVFASAAAPGALAGMLGCPFAFDGVTALGPARDDRRGAFSAAAIGFGGRDGVLGGFAFASGFACAGAFARATIAGFG